MNVVLSWMKCAIHNAGLGDGDNINARLTERCYSRSTYSDHRCYDAFVIAERPIVAIIMCTCLYYQLKND